MRKKNILLVQTDKCDVEFNDLFECVFLNIAVITILDMFYDKNNS